MNRIRRVYALGLPALLIAALWQTNCAPRAKDIRGEIFRSIQEGIAHGSGDFDHSMFDTILRTYSKPERNEFDYAGLKPHQAELESYLQLVSQANLAELSHDSLLALFVNSYNAFTIKSILKTMTSDGPEGVSSIREIRDVFDVKNHVIGGASLSLNNIEHNILRPIFKDPRIHFAINCASASCPPLANRAFTGGRIDEELEAAAQRTVQSADYVRIENGRLRMTKIMDWFGQDFVTPGYRGATGTLPDFIARYASDDVRQFIAAHRGDVPMEFMAYDWSLNRLH